MKKKQKGEISLFKAYSMLWKIMNTKEKVYYILLTMLMIAKAFSALIVAQVLACVVARIEGNTGHIFGIELPLAWSTIQVVIFCYILVTATFIFSAVITNILKKFAVDLSCKVNTLVLDHLTLPRKNLDFHMTHGEALFIAKTAGDSVICLINDMWLHVLVPILSCIVALIYIAQIDILCFLIFFVCFALIITASIIRLKLESRHGENIEHSRSRINNLYLNDIVNLPLITMLKSRSHEKRILDRENNRYKKHWHKLTDMTLWYWVISYIIEYVFVALGVIICILRTGTDPINVENIVVLISYSSQLCSPLESVGVQLGHLEHYAVQFTRLHLLNTTESNLLYDKTMKLENDEEYFRLPKSVAIQNIKMQNMKISMGSFDKEYPNIEFKGNSITVLTGESGKGKTSLVSALLGLKFYDRGDIIINDEYHIKSLYGNSHDVSFVMQDPMIFDRSITDNVAYPEHKLTDTARQFVDTFEFSALVDRETVDGDTITSLSGGEQKRIALIRGLSRPASVYIFDEPTNDLDNDNVTKIIDEIKKLRANSIVIIISHDPRIIDIADNIINI